MSPNKFICLQAAVIATNAMDSANIRKTSVSPLCGNDALIARARVLSRFRLIYRQAESIVQDATATARRKETLVLPRCGSGATAVKAKVWNQFQFHCQQAENIAVNAVVSKGIWKVVMATAFRSALKCGVVATNVAAQA